MAIKEQRRTKASFIPFKWSEEDGATSIIGGRVIIRTTTIRRRGRETLFYDENLARISERRGRKSMVDANLNRFCLTYLAANSSGFT